SGRYGAAVSTRPFQDENRVLLPEASHGVRKRLGSGSQAEINLHVQPNGDRLAIQDRGFILSPRDGFYGRIEEQRWTADHLHLGDIAVLVYDRLEYHSA